MDEFFAEEEEMFADYGAEEPRFEAESKAFERVGTGGLSEYVSSPEVLEPGYKGIISPEDRFLINIDARCRRLKSEDINKKNYITEGDIANILKSTRKDVVNVRLKYINHIAYILGYIASNGGKDLKVKKVQEVINDILPHVADEAGIEPADVVRYARFWNEFL